MKRFLQRLDRFLFAPRDDRALSFGRVALGLALASEWYFVSGHLSSLYGPTGFLQANLMRFVDGWTFPVLSQGIEAYGVSYLSALAAFAALRWLAIVLFTAGYLQRPATVFLWLSQAVLMQSGSHSSYGIDRYFLVLLFLYLFIPTRPLLPLRRFVSREGGKRSPELGFALRYVQLALLVIYVDAGISKALGYDWWTGDAIFRALHLPEFRQLSLLWLADYPWLPRMIGWATMFFEAFYIVGVWVPVVGSLWIIAMIGMHLGIAALMGLTNFGLTLAALNVTFFLLPRWEERAPRTT